MSKDGIAKAMTSFSKELRKKSPTIAVGVGLFCFGCAVASGIKETPKAIRLIEAKKRDLDLKEDEKLPVNELFKAVWKSYVPMALSFTAGACCILGAHKSLLSRNTALATAFNLSNVAFREYREKVVETIGEKHEKNIRDKVAEDRVKKNPPKSSQIFVTGRGKTRCYDPNTGRYFESDLETIRQHINDINNRLNYEHFISLNEFYYEIGLPSVDVGDLLGWNIEDGLIEITPSSILPADGIPTLVIDFMVGPRYEYRR